MDQTIELRVDASLYPREAIVKCLYWYSNEFEIDIEMIEERYHIRLRPLSDMSKERMERLPILLKRDLLDYNLREIVKEQTTSIRELIIAKAFSNGEFDEEPKGDLMDPLGIKFL